MTEVLTNVLTLCHDSRMPRTVPNHKMRWFVYAWNPVTGERRRMPKAANMRGTWGYDAECSCGWKSCTGGATRGSVERDVRDHKYEVTGDWRML